MSSPPPAIVESRDGVGVAVHDLGGPGAGEGSAPTVLIVHATGFNAGAYRPFAAHLARRARVFAVDLRGHGLARTPEGTPFAWDHITDDLASVLDAGVLPAGPVHGVGHSMGGACLVLAADRRPGALRSLWLYEPIIFPPGGFPTAEGLENPMSAAAAKRRPSFPSLEDAIANYSSKPPLDALDPRALRGYVEGGFEPWPDGTVGLRCKPEWEAAVFRMSAGNRAWELLPSLDVPVTVAMGRDEGGPAAFAPMVAEQLPSGRLARHPHLGHFGPLEDPEGIAAEVAAWVAGG